MSDCLMCNTETTETVRGRDGDRTGPMCTDCQHWCDGNLVENPSMARYWHIAHPSWQPGQPLRCRDSLIADGVEIPWLWDEADEGVDGDIVCLFPDTEQGRQHADWMLDDRPGYHIVRVDLPDGIEITRASWEDFPAVRGQIPAEHLTRVNEIA